MRTTVSLDDDLAAHVDDVRSSPDDSDAQAIRECVRRSRRLEACQQERERLQARVDDLERQLMAANQRIDNASELVEYVREERDIQQERSRRERRKETANILVRAKWWVTGLPDAE